MRIAFDIDDTLFKLVEDKEPRLFDGVGVWCSCGTPLKQELDKDMFTLFMLLLETGNEMFIWSAGGMDYATKFASKYFLPYLDRITVLQKGEGHGIDMCFDDQPVKLARINMRVAREHSDHA